MEREHSKWHTHTLHPFRTQSGWGNWEPISFQQRGPEACNGCLLALTLWLRGLQSDGRRKAQTVETPGHRVQVQTPGLSAVTVRPQLLLTSEVPWFLLPPLLCIQIQPWPRAQVHSLPKGGVVKVQVHICRFSIRCLPGSPSAPWTPVLTFLFS